MDSQEERVGFVSGPFPSNLADGSGAEERVRCDSTRRGYRIEESRSNCCSQAGCDSVGRGIWVEESSPNCRNQVSPSSQRGGESFEGFVECDTDCDTREGVKECSGEEGRVPRPISEG